MSEANTEDKQKKLEEAKATTNYILEESRKRERELAHKTASTVITKLQKIEQKNRCMRVRFLDWLSNTLARWSRRAHEMSVRIDSPCAIKLPEKKEKTQSWYSIKDQSRYSIGVPKIQRRKV